MKVQLTSEIRELTTTELDAVSGGVAATDVGFFVVVAGFAAMIPLTIGALWELIFD
jgi:lactobin A/cerein 7B family class IIb bacteriocin